MPDDRASATPSPARGRIGRRWWAVGIAIAAAVVVFLAPLASSDPDGLERVAQDQGFIERAENFVAGLLGGYAIPGMDNAWLSTVLSGLLGVAIVLVVVVLLGRLVARRRA
jgi:ABC-type Fe3+ transport system permease subunit